MYRISMLSRLCGCTILFSPLFSAANAQLKKPEPTHKNIRYGPHKRNVLDFYQAKSTNPAPLVVFIHGGGFRAGSKDKINPSYLRQMLKNGISVAAINYRYVTQAPLPASHYDSLRALQFLRSRAKEWNIDKSRIGAYGGSAGAQICMWLAFHDEMAKPDSKDTLQRESSRLTCVATQGGQTTMDMKWWIKNIPGYKKPHRNVLEMFGVKTKEEYLKKAKQVSALSLISKDDPPIFMTYSMKPDAPAPESNLKARGWMVHHVNFGFALKKKMDNLGIESHLKYPGAQTKYPAIPHFFVAKLVRR